MFKEFWISKNCYSLVDLFTFDKFSHLNLTILLKCKTVINTIWLNLNSILFFLLFVRCMVLLHLFLPGCQDLVTKGEEHDREEWDSCVD